MEGPSGGHSSIVHLFSCDARGQLDWKGTSEPAGMALRRLAPCFALAALVSKHAFGLHAAITAHLWQFLPGSECDAQVVVEACRHGSALRFPFSTMHSSHVPCTAVSARLCRWCSGLIFEPAGLDSPHALFVNHTSASCSCVAVPARYET